MQPVTSLPKEHTHHTHTHAVSQYPQGIAKPVACRPLADPKKFTTGLPDIWSKEALSLELKALYSEGVDSTKILLLAPLLVLKVRSLTLEAAFTDEQGASDAEARQSSEHDVMDERPPSREFGRAKLPDDSEGESQPTARSSRRIDSKEQTRPPGRFGDLRDEGHTPTLATVNPREALIYGEVFTPTKTGSCPRHGHHQGQCQDSATLSAKPSVRIGLSGGSSTSWTVLA